MSSTFTRSAPSPRYRELLSQYDQLHRHGERRLNLPAEKTYNGTSLPRHAASIKSLIEQTAAKSLLDYGSGKGHQYWPMEVRLADGSKFPSIPAYWGVSVLCYDPAYEPFSELPTGTYDGVICTDVLEHCSEQDIPWIVEELFSFARRFVFANVACYEAMKHLPNGENAHCTVRPKSWWQEMFARAAGRRSDVQFEVCLDEVVAAADGKRTARQSSFRG